MMSFMVGWVVVVVYRGGKTSGAWEHCSQKELDQTILVRKILPKCNTLVTIFMRKAFYPTSVVGLMKNSEMNKIN